MQIKIGSFSKRHNSTKQPASSWGTTLADVELKEDTSMEEPVFRIGFSNWDPAYNYIYVPSWGRYYFVIDVTVRIGRIWEVACRLDAAATYKADIQATTAFILYDTAANTEIVDHRLGVKTTATYSENYVILNENASAAGSYLCAVTGEYSTMVYRIPSPAWLGQVISGGANPDQGLQGFLSAQFPNLDEVPSTDWFENLAYYVKQTGKNLVASGSNIVSNVRSLIWVPWLIQTTQTASFCLGQYKPAVIADVVTTLFQRTSAQVAIPWQFSDWRRNEPYTEIYLYIPFVGVVHIPSSQVVGQTALDVQIAFNQFSGEIALRVYAGNVQIGAYGANTAVQIPVGSSNVTPAQKVTAIAGVAGGIGAAIASGNVFGAAVSAASLAAIKPIASSTGGISGGAGGGLDLNIRCVTVCHNTNVEPNTVASVIGTPTMASNSLSSKSGYVQTQDISIQGANMSDAVRQELNQMCNNGIFIE